MVCCGRRWWVPPPGLPPGTLGRTDVPQSLLCGVLAQKAGTGRLRLRLPRGAADNGDGAAAGCQDDADDDGGGGAAAVAADGWAAQAKQPWARGLLLATPQEEQPCTWPCSGPPALLAGTGTDFSFPLVPDADRAAGLWGAAWGADSPAAAAPVPWAPPIGAGLGLGTGGGGGSGDGIGLDGNGDGGGGGGGLVRQRSPTYIAVPSRSVSAACPRSWLHCRLTEYSPADTCLLPAVRPSSAAHAAR
eukprot:SAG22_NODE_2137_length_2956_cov_8.564928_2_plen_246_part_00